MRLIYEGILQPFYERITLVNEQLNFDPIRHVEDDKHRSEILGTIYSRLVLASQEGLKQKQGFERIIKLEKMSLLSPLNANITPELLEMKSKRQLFKKLKGSTVVSSRNFRITTDQALKNELRRMFSLSRELAYVRQEISSDTYFKIIERIFATIVTLAFSVNLSNCDLPRLPDFVADTINVSKALDISSNQFTEVPQEDRKSVV